MKNFTVLNTTFLFVVALFFCSSAIGQKKVALVSFIVNKQINTDGLGPLAKNSGKLVSSLTDLVDDPEFNLKPILLDFKEKFYNEFVPDLPFEIIPEDKVINNDEYMSYIPVSPEEDSKKIEEYQSIDGYKVLTILRWNLLGVQKNSVDFDKMIQIFKNEANGIMTIEMYYGFEPMGFGNVIVSTRVSCYISMRLWNIETEKKKKQVFWILESGSSKDVIPAPGGIPIAKTDKMLELCKQATDRLLADLSKKGKMKKIVKKAAKKF